MIYIYTSPSKEGAALAEETVPDGEEPATGEVKEDSWQIFLGQTSWINRQREIGRWKRRQVL